MIRLVALAALLAAALLGDRTGAQASAGRALLNPQAVTPTASPTAGPTSTGGWPGSPSLYLGRYRVKKSSNHHLAQSGQLTIFLRDVKGVPQPLLSGILALFGPAGNNIFYLTHLSARGKILTAQASVGSYTGPVVGEFDVTSWQPPRMTARVLLRGRRVTTLHFVRFSTNPQP